MQLAQNGTSTFREFAIGLPTSSVSRSASSSQCSRMSSAKRSRTFFFLVGSASRQTPLSKAFRADRRDLGERRAVGRRDIGAVDEGAPLDFERGGAGEPAFAGGRTIEHIFSPFGSASEGAAKIARISPSRNRIFKMMRCLGGMGRRDPPFRRRGAPALT